MALGLRLGTARKRRWPARLETLLNAGPDVRRAAFQLDIAQGGSWLADRELFIAELQRHLPGLAPTIGLLQQHIGRAARRGPRPLLRIVDRHEFRGPRASCPGPSLFRRLSERGPSGRPRPRRPSARLVYRRVA